MGTDPTEEKGGPIDFADVLAEEFQHQFGVTLARKSTDEGSSDSTGRNEPGAALGEVYKAIRGAGQPQRSALCLSGGGIRSATFNLGVLQGLAREGLLHKFDYLSTVSGGGFVGSWLTAWIHRKNSSDASEVSKELGVGPEPGRPDPDTVLGLREYSNYLTPATGLLSADTWTLIAVYLRNLALTSVVFVPALMSLLMVPRFGVAMMRDATLSAIAPWAHYAAVLFGAMSLAYIGLSLPSTKTLNLSRRNFLLFALAPLVTSAALFGLVWVWRSNPWSPWLGSMTALAVVTPGFVFVAARHLITTYSARTKTTSLATALGPAVLAILLAALLIGAVSAGLGYLTSFIPVPASEWYQLYSVVAVPAILFLMMTGGTLFAGLTSRYTGVADQEWWARTGGWLLIVCLAWITSHVVVLYGPSALASLMTANVAVVGEQELTGGNIVKMLTGIVGILATLTSLFGGYSSKTSADGGKTGSGKESSSPALFAALTSVLATVALLYIFAILALTTDWILHAVEHAAAPTLQGVLTNGVHSAVLNNSTPLQLLGTAAGLFGISIVLGRLINTNRFSLHYFWKNRIVRAYLGASRPKVDSTGDTRNRFTGFDEQDDIKMHELRHVKRPLHILNLTLNLLGSKKLEWQERKAESFTVSALHSGSWQLGYRDSKTYADEIKLGTAVAISGAAVSPNMGYMMSSAVVRFLMTIFNIRLGWWLGNPAKAGDRTYQQASPRLSLKPMAIEALGLTSEKTSYVYLSDGGHFENLGLYEMVLRRCDCIVVSDASTDTTYDCESLGQSIRKIRIDLGVSILFKSFKILKASVAEDPSSIKGVYYAIGDIDYEEVDGPGVRNGVLVYIKPTLFGTEPRDLLNYFASNPTFPQESIADQFFSESQFESYRALGEYIVHKLCSDPAKPVSCELFSAPPPKTPPGKGSVPTIPSAV